jgi:GNAT superfamily N-acetyltransferase
MRWGPWLASAYVVPEWRGKGLFILLHDTLIAYAESEIQSPQVYVYSHIDFKKLGWTAIKKIQDPFAPDHEVTIFRRILNPTPST